MSTRDIEKECGKGRSTVSFWIKKYGLTDYMRYKKLPTLRFEKIDTKEKAYALGFILADGYINELNDVEISVALEDKEVADFFADNFCGTVNTVTKIDRKKRLFPKARWHRRIHDILKFTGGRIKCERHYPRVRDDLERYLLQGVFDADGCITWGRRKDKNRIWQKVSFTTQLKIAEGIQQYLLKKLNISTRIYPKSKSDCYVIDFSNKKDVLKLYHHLYDDNDMIILKRKYLKFRALRLELEENGGSEKQDSLYRAEPAEQEGVETSGEQATVLNDRDSIQGQYQIAG